MYLGGTHPGSSHLASPEIGLTNPRSAVRHGARAKLATCRSYLPPCTPCDCAGSAKIPLGGVPAGSVRYRSGWDRADGKKPGHGAVPDTYPDRVCLESPDDHGEPSPRMAHSRATYGVCDRLPSWEFQSPGRPHHWPVRFPDLCV